MGVVLRYSGPNLHFPDGRSITHEHNYRGLRFRVWIKAGIRAVIVVRAKGDSRKNTDDQLNRNVMFTCSNIVHSGDGSAPLRS